MHVKCKSARASIRSRSGKIEKCWFVCMAGCEKMTYTLGIHSSVELTYTFSLRPRVAKFRAVKFGPLAAGRECSKEIMHVEVIRAVGKISKTEAVPIVGSV